MTLLHHVSIINRNAEDAFHFYRNILGLDLTMKTVNQDDHRMYHLFFGDNEGRVGSEVTIFEITKGPDKKFGTNDIERLLFKVPSIDSLHFWLARLDAFNVCHYGIERFANRDLVRFEGPDNTGLGFVVMHESEQIDEFMPPQHTEIPLAHRILALDSVHLRTRFSKATVNELERYHDFKERDTLNFFDSEHNVSVLSNDDVMYHEIYVIQDNQSENSVSSIGSIHHVAISIADTEHLRSFEASLNERNIVNSSIKNREFFQSIYYRDPNHILIEIATVEGKKPTQPNQSATEFKHIPLVLPEYLESKREVISSQLTH
ncbi:VOC family protein [Macrococcus armenti]|uniref:VOC family protein n=1 Tax=Macrococcus armenti TaxID=2875764 RepID=UPI001CD0189A|nr:VOC family protein [Macrococcus armenti]UBH15447.1 VOC family protein [Macrococcus armenti]UBH17807.1 VOC family protein [Macrococcus armenti]UBH20072.1 VOC family protein [Macrococcus armenti]